MNGSDTVFTCMLWSLIIITIILVVVFKMNSVRNQTNDTDAMVALAAHGAAKLKIGSRSVLSFFPSFWFSLNFASVQLPHARTHYAGTSGPYTPVCYACVTLNFAVLRENTRNRINSDIYIELDIAVHGEESGGRYNADIYVRTKHS